MDFGGNLSIVQPQTIFQTFSMSSLSGMLKFVTVGNVASFYFDEGALIFATIDTRKKRIGEFLIERGHITADQLDNALEAWRAMKGRERIGQIMIERRFIEFDSLAASIKDQMKEVVYEVLPWKKGYFIFFNNVKPENEDILLDLFDVRVDYLLLEGLRRLDENAKCPTG